MTEVIENVFLEHMKRFQAGQDRMEGDLKDITRSLSNLESGLAVIGEDIGRLATSITSQGASMDRVSKCIDRIERRLDLTDAS